MIRRPNSLSDRPRSLGDALSDLRKKYETEQLNCFDRAALGEMIAGLEEFCRHYTPAQYVRCTYSGRR
jgi:hypothetical protein